MTGKAEFAYGSPGAMEIELEPTKHIAARITAEHLSEQIPPKNINQGVGEIEVTVDRMTYSIEPGMNGSLLMTVKSREGAAVRFVVEPVAPNALRLVGV